MWISNERPHIGLQRSDLQKHKVFDDFLELDLQNHKVFDDLAELDLQKHKVFDEIVCVECHPGP